MLSLYQRISPPHRHHAELQETPQTRAVGSRRLFLIHGSRCDSSISLVMPSASNPTGIKSIHFQPSSEASGRER